MYSVGQVIGRDDLQECIFWCKKSNALIEECGRDEQGNVAYRIVEMPQDYLDDSKLSKTIELRSTRDLLEVSPINYKGCLFDFDQKSRERIQMAIITLELSESNIMWTLADNTEVSVSADDLKGVIAMAGVRSDRLHTAYRLAKERVERAITMGEVESITLEVENSGL